MKARKIKEQIIFITVTRLKRIIKVVRITILKMIYLRKSDLLIKALKVKAFKKLLLIFESFKKVKNNKSIFILNIK